MHLTLRVPVSGGEGEIKVMGGGGRVVLLGQFEGVLEGVGDRVSEGLEALGG